MPDTLLQYLRDGGIIGLLLLAFVGGFKRWWVFGWHYDSVCRERDEWKQLALRGTVIAGQAVELATTSTSKGSALPPGPGG